MSELSDQYRQAPRLQPPISLDQAILDEARRRTAAPPRSAGLWRAAPLLATVGVAVLGVTLLLRSGVPPLQKMASPAREDSAPVALDELPVAPDNQRNEVRMQADSLAETAASELAVEDSAETVSSARSAKLQSFSVEVPPVPDETRRAKTSMLNDLSVSDSMQSESARLGIESTPLQRNKRELSVRPNTADKQWVLAQPPGRFLLVLQGWKQTDVGRLREAKLRVVLVEVGSVDNLKEVLVAGSFTSREQARSAIVEHGLAATDVNVELFSTIQSQLR